MKSAITSRQFFQLVFLYWRSKDRSVKTSAFYFALSILLVVFVVCANVYLNKLSGNLMDGIQNYNLPVILKTVIIMIILFLIYSVFAAYQDYFYALMRIRWRNWLTSHLVQKWLVSKAYYQIETFGSTIDNADQRISEDIAGLVNIFSDLTLGLFNAVLSFGSFAVILWSLSVPLTIPLGHGHHITIYGDMLWFAILYSVITTLITFKIGRPLINLSFMQQRFEAFFRFNLMRIRENSEQIALYHAEPFEKQSLQTRFNDVINNFIAVARRIRLLALFTTLITSVAQFIPTLLALPGYFARKYGMGGIAQIGQAFAVVSKSLDFFIVNYIQVASIVATAERLQLLIKESDRATHPKPLAYAHLKMLSAKHEISFKKVTLYKPNGEVLLKDLNFEFKQGEHTLIMGRSGIGKSTILRTIAGMWPFATGTLKKPDIKIWFVPQKPYLPQGSIRDLMTFPDPSLYDENKIREALEAVGLGHLFQDYSVINWNNTLSLGEQQRLAFARIFLHEPDWLLLDEATSSLDEASEAKLYTLLTKKLPKMTLISVGHRSTLKELHQKVLRL